MTDEDAWPPKGVPRWNRHGFAHWGIARFLDALYRFPGTQEASAIVGDLTPVIEDGIRTAIELRRSGRFDYDAFDAVAVALASNIDQLPNDSYFGAPDHDAVMAAAYLGVAVGSGGMASYARYARRYGDIASLAREVGPGDRQRLAANMARARDNLDAALQRGDVEYQGSYR